MIKYYIRWGCTVINTGQKIDGYFGGWVDGDGSNGRASYTLDGSTANALKLNSLDTLITLNLMNSRYNRLEQDGVVSGYFTIIIIADTGREIQLSELEQQMRIDIEANSGSRVFGSATPLTEEKISSIVAFYSFAMSMQQAFKAFISRTMPTNDFNIIVNNYLELLKLIMNSANSHIATTRSIHINENLGQGV